jgi:flagella synthesis protein FlgN
MTDRSADLVGVLRQECAAARAFVAILEREKDALTAGAVDDLARIADDKAAAARELAELTGTRHHTLLALGYSADAKGTRAWLAHTGDAQAAAAWRELDLLAWQAREANRVNGAMISSWLQHNQRALAILRGASATASLYDSSGTTPGGGLSRSLAQA